MRNAGLQRVKWQEPERNDGAVHTADRLFARTAFSPAVTVERYKLLKEWIQVQYWQVSVSCSEGQADTVATVFQEWPEVQGVLFGGGLPGGPMHPEYGEWFAPELLRQASQQVLVQFYLPQWLDESTVNARVRAGLEELETLGVPADTVQWNLTSVDEEEWAASWQEDFQPFPVGQRFVVVPTAMRPWPEDGVRAAIYLDIGRAFGTGLHATTQMCLERLEKLVTPQSQVLDIGCGTGILSIAAAKLGANRVVAVDLDCVAVHATRNNCEANAVGSKVGVFEGDLLTSLPVAPYDVVVANILRTAVLELAQVVPQYMPVGGSFISSGFLRQDIAMVSQALVDAGFRVHDEYVRDAWAALWAVREG